MLANERDRIQKERYYQDVALKQQQLQFNLDRLNNYNTQVIQETRPSS